MVDAVFIISKYKTVASRGIEPWPSLGKVNKRYYYHRLRGIPSYVLLELRFYKYFLHHDQGFGAYPAVSCCSSTRLRELWCLSILNYRDKGVSFRISYWPTQAIAAHTSVPDNILKY